MLTNKIISFIESSFLYELITDEEITDISFNGDSLFYLHNKKGRKKSQICISNNDAKDFVRQIANLSEKQFSFQNPSLDVSAGKYRLNAVHNSIARYGDDEAITFSMRIASSKPRITDESDFLTIRLVKLLELLIKSNISIVIGGITGSGKTEFQKYLINKMEEAMRIIVIDNVLELSQGQANSNADINVWQIDDRNTSNSIQSLVRNALRSNPDWVIVAESRGGEMLEILNSAMTGHPIITTIHARSVDNMLARIVRMVMMNDKRSDYKEVLEDVSDSFPIHIFLKRKILKNGQVKRFIDSINFVDGKGKIVPIYRHKEKAHLFFPLPEELLNLFDEEEKKVYISRFGGKGNDNV